MTEPRHKYNRRSIEGGRPRHKQKKRTNPGIGTADVTKETDKLRHKHSERSKESKVTAIETRFPIV